jgi:uridine phosphorylase
MTISKSDLILNSDGSVYHLNLLPEDLAPTVFLVGDPSRVNWVTKHFDSIEVKKHKREFVAQTGYLGKKRITVIGTGIGSGNIDIVLNEIDALANIDLNNRTVKATQTQLDIIRLGTSGSLDPAITPDSYVISNAAFSFDGLLNFYKYKRSTYEQNLFNALNKHFTDWPMVGNLYLAQGSKTLIEQFESFCVSGITFSCIGFYGPQYRDVRAPIADKNLIQHTTNLQLGPESIANFEMETAAIYGLGRVLNHRCCSISTIVANRIDGSVTADPNMAIKKMIHQALELFDKGLY